MSDEIRFQMNVIFNFNVFDTECFTICFDDNIPYIINF